MWTTIVDEKVRGKPNFFNAYYETDEQIIRVRTRIEPGEEKEFLIHSSSVKAGLTIWETLTDCLKRWRSRLTESEANPDSLAVIPIVELEEIHAFLDANEPVNRLHERITYKIVADKVVFYLQPKTEASIDSDIESLIRIQSLLLMSGAISYNDLSLDTQAFLREGTERDSIRPDEFGAIAKFILLEAIKEYRCSLDDELLLPVIAFAKKKYLDWNYLNRY